MPPIITVLNALFVAIDAKRISSVDGSSRWEVFTHGGRKATGIDAIEWAKKCNLWEPVKFYSPAWIEMAHVTVLILP